MLPGLRTQSADIITVLGGSLTRRFAWLLRLYRLSDVSVARSVALALTRLTRSKREYPLSMQEIFTFVLQNILIL